MISSFLSFWLQFPSSSPLLFMFRFHWLFSPPKLSTSFLPLDLCLGYPLFLKCCSCSSMPLPQSTYAHSQRETFQSQIWISPVNSFIAPYTFCLLEYIICNYVFIFWCMCSSRPYNPQEQEKAFSLTTVTWHVVPNWHSVNIWVNKQIN